MPINLKICDKTCHECVKEYAKKHRLKKTDRFEIPCDGIPLKYIPDHILASIPHDSELAIAMLDPVTWAAKFLDWHCLDPDGSVWKRKTEDGSLGEVDPYDPVRALAGKSPYHRPYQSAMLRCQSKRKVFVCGRQIGKTISLCITILYYLFTRQNFSILVLAPYQSQVDLIFTKVISFLNSNPTLKSSIKRNVKAPNYTIELHNGSIVRGFTAGTKSNNAAGSVRGQSSSMLILEEADYLAPGDMDSVASVITNFPQATVIMSSTPTGRRERFYENANNKTFKTFHYPSYVNPNWTEELDAFYRSSLTGMGYQHEVLAAWGSQEEGIYQLKFIEAAQDDYTYKDMKRYHDWIYSVGVDWNDIKIGTSIIVVGWNPHDGIFRVVDKLCVSKEGWQQIYACQKVVEMNSLWQPKWIYIDHGFGHMQAEILKKFGLDAITDPARGPGHRDARLARIVKPYDFGGHIEVRDPFTKQMVHRPAKPFLVENSMRRFETLSIRYPKSDNQMTKALLGYRIKRVSIGGVPVYEQADTEAGDHFLDAMNLSLLAFTMEESEFGKAKFQTKVAFTSVSPLSPKPEQDTKSPVSVISPTSGRSELAQRTGSNYQTTTLMWPGFEHDAPKPDLNKRGQNRLFPRREYYRPNRKNI
jgi:replicative DNA helicase